MYKLSELMEILNGYAPLELSYKAIEKGSYDNSGVIINSHDEIKKIMFSLDLSKKSVEYAIKEKVDTIVTHHPAIYTPIKTLSTAGETASLLTAVKCGMNVISMHLNLDMAKCGIDHYLAKGLGASETKILDKMSNTEGYGREFEINTCLVELVQRVKEEFKSDKIIAYGDGAIKKVASFCGGGSDHALKAVCGGETDADTIISSDIPHHVLKELVENDKKVIIIPHYVSEQYGFEKFYAFIKTALGKKADAYYFLDKRFM